MKREDVRYQLNQVAAHGAVMKAYSEGKEVEFLDERGGWGSIDSPGFAPSLAYRIKKVPDEIWIQRDSDGVKRVTYAGMGIRSPLSKKYREVIEE